jgi:hypothetical protein
MQATCSAYLIFTIIDFLGIIRRPVSYFFKQRTKDNVLIYQYIYHRHKIVDVIYLIPTSIRLNSH